MSQRENMRICFDDFMERMSLDMDETEQRAVELDFIAEWLEQGNEITPTMRRMFAESLRECAELLTEKTLV